MGIRCMSSMSRTRDPETEEPKPQGAMDHSTFNSVPTRSHGPLYVQQRSSQGAMDHSSFNSVLPKEPWTTLRSTVFFPRSHGPLCVQQCSSQGAMDPGTQGP